MGNAGGAAKLRFLEEVKVRFAAVGLTLNDEKMRVLEFGPFGAENCTKRGRRKPQTFVGAD